MSQNGTDHFGTFTHAKYKIWRKYPSLTVKVLRGGDYYFCYCLYMYNLKHSTSARAAILGRASCVICQWTNLDSLLWSAMLLIGSITLIVSTMYTVIFFCCYWGNQCKEEIDSGSPLPLSNGCCRVFLKFFSPYGSFLFWNYIFHRCWQKCFILMCFQGLRHYWSFFVMKHHCYVWFYVLLSKTMAVWTALLKPIQRIWENIPCWLGTVTPCYEMFNSKYCFFVCTIFFWKTTGRFCI